MNYEDLENRIEKLEFKAFFWDIATGIIGIVSIIIIFKDIWHWINNF